MDKKTQLATLQTFFMFRELRENVLQKIAEKLEEEYFPQNAIIIQQGDIGDKIYFIAKGTAQAYVVNKQGQEVNIGNLAPGDYFGELAILIDGYRTCFIKSVSACEVYSLSKKNFNKLIADQPEILKAMNKILSQRLAETLKLVREHKNNEVILLIGADEAHDRTSLFLYYFEKISSRPIKIIENKSASQVSRILNELSDHFVFVKLKPDQWQDFQEYANHIINFVEENTGHISLHSCTQWKIEHTARVIAKKTIGIALCSGGAPAAAHLGVLKELQNQTIPLDYIVGSSAGAFFGGCFAFGCPIEKIRETVNKEAHSNVFFKMLGNFSFHFSGLMRADYYRHFFQQFIGTKNLEESTIPFAAVSSDLYSGKTVVINTGSAVEAILASNAAPVMVEPIRMDGKLLVDGVATSPLPTQVLLQQKIDIKIAVPIPQLDLAISMDQDPKLPAVYVRSRSMMAQEMMSKGAAMADVIIEPDVHGIKMLAWDQFDKIIEAGEKATAVAVNRINYLLTAKKAV